MPDDRAANIVKTVSRKTKLLLTKTATISEFDAMNYHGNEAYLLPDRRYSQFANYGPTINDVATMAIGTTDTIWRILHMKENSTISKFSPDALNHTKAETVISQTLGGHTDPSFLHSL